MRIILINIVAIVIGYFLGNAIASAADKPEAKCYNNKEFMTIIDNKDLVTLFSSKTTTEKTQEVLINKNRESYIVEYDKPANGSATSSDKYCVINFTHDLSFNDSAIEFLYKILEKVKGQKT